MRWRGCWHVNSENPVEWLRSPTEVWGLVRKEGWAESWALPIGKGRAEAMAIEEPWEGEDGATSRKPGRKGLPQGNQPSIARGRRCGEALWKRAGKGGRLSWEQGVARSREGLRRCLLIIRPGEGRWLLMTAMKMNLTEHFQCLQL